MRPPRVVHFKAGARSAKPFERVGAGIGTGDVIISVAGKSTLTSDQLGAALAGLRPGQSVRVRLVRQNGTSATVTVKLGELPGG